MPTQPQDHKAKKKSSDFRFTGPDGTSHTLPPVATAREKLTGGQFEDAVLGGELGMLAYMVKCLHAADADPAALAALRALPQAEYLQVLNDWGDRGDGHGASLGE